MRGRENRPLSLPLSFFLLFDRQLLAVLGSSSAYSYVLLLLPLRYTCICTMLPLPSFPTTYVCTYGSHYIPPQPAGRTVVRFPVEIAREEGKSSLLPVVIRLLLLLPAAAAAKKSYSLCPKLLILLLLLRRWKVFSLQSLCTYSRSIPSFPTNENSFRLSRDTIPTNGGAVSVPT